VPHSSSAVDGDRMVLVASQPAELADSNEDAMSVARPAVAGLASAAWASRISETYN
jgi:hypothetical protein